MPREAPRSGSRSYAPVKKPIVTIKVELSAMTTTDAYKKGIELAEAIREEDGRVRVKSLGVTN